MAGEKENHLAADSQPLFGGLIVSAHSSKGLHQSTIFPQMRRRHFLRRNLFIDPVQMLSPLRYYKASTPTFLMIFVVTIPFTEIKEKVGRRLLKIIQDTFSEKKSIFDTEYRTF